MPLSALAKQQVGLEPGSLTLFQEPVKSGEELQSQSRGQTHRAITRPLDRLPTSQQEFKLAERAICMEMTPITFLVGPLYRASLPLPCLGSQRGLKSELSMPAGTRGTQVLHKRGSWLVATLAWVVLFSLLPPSMSRRILPKSICGLISPVLAPHDFCFQSMDHILIERKASQRPPYFLAQPLQHLYSTLLAMAASAYMEKSH